MSDMVEVIIESIRVSLMSQQRIVILRERDADRYLPIWIGVFEAESITIALQEVEVARPLTHDLIKNIFDKLNARILRVEVTALRDDTFYGNIVIERNGEIINIDSRPSDALAIAVRAHIPVFVDRAVMDAAAIIPDKDLKKGEHEQTVASESIQPIAEEVNKESEERLEIFQDFFDQLNIENFDEEDTNEDDDKEDNNEDTSMGNKPV